MNQVPYLITPWAHQAAAIKAGAIRDNYALFFEMGTGKTMTAINTLRHWFLQENAIKNTLILCPQIVIDQWAEEFKKHSRLSRHIVLVKGTGKKRVEIFEKALESRKASIFITNYETLLVKGIMPLLMRRWFALICDESHKLKNHKAKRTALVTQIADLSRKKLILTGSPVLNTPMDIFSQYRILDGGKSFDKNFFTFRARYFYDKNINMPPQKHFPDWCARPQTIDTLSRIMATTCHKAVKSECLDLPPLVKMEIPVELSKEQRKAYDEMKEDLITYLNGKAAIASIALVKALRLQQITSGFIGTEDKGEHSFKSVPRLKVLHELLGDLTPDNKVIVWASFKNNYNEIRKICDDLKIEYVEINGDLSAKEKQESIQKFRTEVKYRVCIANPKAGGVGVNLIEASYSIYFSRGYSLEDDLQSESRNYRGGSECHDKVTRIDLVCRGTIDEIILRALRKKQSIADRILDLKGAL